MRRPSFEPSLDEIAAGCRTIQAGWSDEERFRRMKGDVDEPGIVPMGGRQHRSTKKAH